MWNEPQLHISNVAELTNTVPVVTNRDFFVKPFGGLWTSTLVDNSSAWVDWCRDENFGEPDKMNWFVLHPKQDARVYVINTLSDLRRLIARYPHPDREQQIYGRMFGYVDFPRIALDYDAVHLTDAGQQATRHSEPSLYGWDCESTLWFRWQFTEVTQWDTMTTK